MLFPEDADPSTWPLGIFTCHTKNCPFEGIANAIPCWEGIADANVLCGGCRAPITDRVEAPKGTEPGMVEKES